MPRADRLFALVQLLSGTRRRTLEELVSSLGASPRTVYRDLAALEDRGLPIERDEGRYRLVAGAPNPSLPLTDRERLLLDLLLYDPALAAQPAFRRTLSQLQARFASGSDQRRAAAAGPERSGQVNEAVVNAIERAISAAHSVSILYTSLSDGRPRWRGVDPWILLHRCEAWYLVGRCHEHDEARMFRMDRIDEVLPIGTAFERPRFDPASWFANAWGVYTSGAEEHGYDVVIVFEASVAPLIAHARYHGTEEKRRIEGGRIEYRVRVAPLEEIARWVVSFGGAARAVEPPELVDLVRSLAAGAIASHDVPRLRRSARRAGTGQ